MNPARYRLFISAVACLSTALCGDVQAAPRSSANYSIPTESVEPGGGRVESVNYRADASIGGITGVSSAPSEIVKHGYAGQLYDVVALSVSGPSTDNLNETASRQLQALPMADDLTTLAPLDPLTVVWSIVSGPIASLSSSGLATAGAVFQDSAAAIGGTAQGLSGQWSFTVLNVASDDYKSYAADGIDDSWQVEHFGEENADAAPAVDADGDGQNNLFEFTAGLLPNDPNSVFRLRVESVAGQPTQRRLIFSPRVEGRIYTPEFRTGLTSGDWDTLTGTTQIDSGGERSITDPNATGASKFYRIDITKP